MQDLVHDLTTSDRADGPADDRLRARRDFLRVAGLSGAALFLAACAADSAVAPSPNAAERGKTGEGVGRDATVVLDFSTDIGVLNYAYALEQLEAAFYSQVVATPYSGISAPELRLLTDLRNHEVIHREFFKAAIGSARIPNLTVNFSSINFASRTSVLGAAQAFEDLGVSAYNGAARYLQSATYLTLAGKIVSVEARHASAIRDRISPRSGSFAPNAFDAPNTPQTVINTASTYIVDKITVINA